MTTLNTKKSIDRSHLRLGFILISMVVVCCALSPTAQAVMPAPDGGYANGNTAEGTNALFSLTTGPNNTAVGFHALYDNTTGRENTAMGLQALLSNTTGPDNTATGFNTLLNNITGDSTQPMVLNRWRATQLASGIRQLALMRSL